MRQFLRIGVALVLCAVLTASPAIACCDDFWSCAAAVATLGLSCAAEAAINALRGLIATVRTLEEQHKVEFDEGLAAIQRDCDALKAKLAQLVAKAEEDLQRFEKEADSIVGEDATHLATNVNRNPAVLQTKAATPTPPPSVARLDTLRVPTRTPTPNAAHPGAVPAGAGTGSEYMSVAQKALMITPESHETMKDLRKELDDIRKKMGELEKQLKAKEAQALGLEIAAATQARKVFADSFLTRVDTLLASLEDAVTHPLNIGNLVSASASLLDGLISGYNRDVPPAVDKAGADMNAAAGLPAPPAYQAAALARQAAAILDKMRRAKALVKAAERLALPMNVSGALAGETFQAVRLSPAAISLVGITKKTAPRFVALRPTFEKVRTASLTKVDVLPFRTRVGSELDGMFRGKSRADGRQKRDELLAEARRRFAADPKTLQAVESYLVAEARARGVTD